MFSDSNLYLVVVLLGFFIRFLPRLVRPNQLATDTYFHLYCARIIRANGMKVPKRLPGIATEHRYSYPFLYHYFLALLPLSGRKWLERCTGALFDALNGLLAYYFCRWLVNTNQVSQELASMPLWVLTLFTFSPALLRLGSGPRAYNGSPRVMGQFLYLTHILGAFYAYSTGSMIGLLVSILAGAATMATAKFSNQVIVWFGLFFAIAITWTYVPLVIASFVVSLLLTKGRVLWVIGGQVNHSKYYFKHLQSVFLYPTVRSWRQYADKTKSLFTALLEKRSTTNVGRLFYWYLTDSYLWHLFFTVYPQFLFALYIGFTAQNVPHHQFLFVWMFAGFVGFLLTKFPTLHLMFLGAGERYLEYALLPSILLCVEFLLPDYAFLLFAWLAYSLLSTIFYLAQYFYINNKKTYEQTEAVFAQLREFPTGPILPIGSFQWQALYRSDCPVVTYGTNIEERYIPPEEYTLLFSNYPFPSGDLKKVLEHFKIEYILTDVSKLANYKKNILNSDQKYEAMTELLSSSDTLQIYRVVR